MNPPQHHGHDDEGQDPSRQDHPPPRTKRFIAEMMHSAKTFGAGIVVGLLALGVMDWTNWEPHPAIEFAVVVGTAAASMWVWENRAPLLQLFLKFTRTKQGR